MGCGDGAGVRAAKPSEKPSIAPSSVAFDTRSSGLLKNPVSGSAAWRFTRRGRDGFAGTGLCGCPSSGQARRPRTGAGACPCYDEQFDDRDSLPPQGGFFSPGAALMGSRIEAIMEIMIFSIKFDKFTMFFDKFLKISYYLTDFNTKSYHINLSVLHSDMAVKKVIETSAFARNFPHFRARLTEGRFRSRRSRNRRNRCGAQPALRSA